MRAFDAFFKEIDATWQPVGAGKIPLRILGCAALSLQTDYERGTKDGDVLETDAVTPAVQQQLLGLAGPGTRLSVRHRLHIDIVHRGLAFLPHVPAWRPCVALNRELTHFEIELLDVVDVVVSKLKRFHANDVGDIRAMVDRGLVEHPRLIERFRSAVDVFSGDARASDLPRYVENLHRIERDDFDVPESDIELPEWI